MEQHRAFPHAGECGNAGGTFAVSQLRVDVVRNDQQIVLACDLGNAFGLFIRQHGARGIAGEVQQDRLGPGRDGFFQIVRIEGERVLLVGIHADRHAVCHADLRHIGNVAGFVENDLIAGGGNGTDHQVQRLADANGDQAFALGIVLHPVVPCQIVADRFTQGESPQIACVAGSALFQRKKGTFADRPRRHEIRFPHAQRDHILHGADDIKKLADSAFRQDVDMFRNEITG